MLSAKQQIKIYKNQMKKDKISKRKLRKLMD